MRSDTLAQLISHGGVHAGARVMIFESCNGLVTGAAAYRMGGKMEIGVMLPVDAFLNASKDWDQYLLFTAGNSLI